MKARVQETKFTLVRARTAKNTLTDKDADFFFFYHFGSCAKLNPA